MRQRLQWLVVFAFLVNLVLPTALLIAKEVTADQPWALTWSSICRDQGSTGRDEAPNGPPHHGVVCPLCVVLGSHMVAPGPGPLPGIAPPILVAGDVQTTEIAAPARELHSTPQQARAPPYPA